jgi:hypothetical protein
MKMCPSVAKIHKNSTDHWNSIKFALQVESDVLISVIFFRFSIQSGTVSNSVANPPALPSEYIQSGGMEPNPPIQTPERIFHFEIPGDSPQHVRIPIKFHRIFETGPCQAAS